MMLRDAGAGDAVDAIEAAAGDLPDEIESA